MNSLRAEIPRPTTSPFVLPFYYGWVNVAVAALAMVGTLPGRTQGLGLITEPLLVDLQIDRVLFARINLWATLIGALFCLGIGRLIDHFGSRVVLAVVTVALGAVVLLMSGASGVVQLACLSRSSGPGQARFRSSSNYCRPVVRARGSAWHASYYCAERRFMLASPSSVPW